MSSTKTLVAYFSASGETARLARTIASVCGADLHEIQPAQPYTAADLDWHDQTSRSSVEMNDPTSRPAIANRVTAMDAYDTVFVGFPIWWYVAPTIVNTFLEAYDFAGKTVIPFATSGGSGMGRTEDILKTCCSPDTRWLPGKRLASRAREAEVRRWVESLGL
ncbi:MULTISPECIES: flavodoxin [Gordonibacter]|uniref:Flavodoxin n=1 Tax=Gordonibacter faecis TaxID=3047475 RepID=A0ABT7DNQ9_9ACTN|nr:MULTISPECIES: flavodoxin [unclassified Gordonibacter]MDJ1651171.1 flavodoxin [Gordonibacter sp. KGMB12511]HIW77363.1 NAD(P)H-dependent oxidoreductase [Candidatus Gordonibacter avicola]